MGQLKDGVWTDVEPPTPRAADGSFQRPQATFRSWITDKGHAGPTGIAGHRAERNRYHLFVSPACPWSHRVMLARALKGLASVVDAHVVRWRAGDGGWAIPSRSGSAATIGVAASRLHELYARSRNGYTGPTETPVLWDQSLRRIVSNHCDEIVAMLDAVFDAHGAAARPLRASAQDAEAAAANDQLVDPVAEGVYRVGHARGQEAADRETHALFDRLDALETRLTDRRFLLGPEISEPDLRLYAALIRFDTVYHSLYRCNLRQIASYPALSAYLADLHNAEGVAETTDLDAIRRYYYVERPKMNPTGLTPVGPRLSLDPQPERERLGRL